MPSVIMNKPSVICTCYPKLLWIAIRKICTYYSFMKWAVLLSSGKNIKGEAQEVLVIGQHKPLNKVINYLVSSRIRYWMSLKIGKEHWRTIFLLFIYIYNYKPQHSEDISAFVDISKDGGQQLDLLILDTLHKVSQYT